MSQIKFIEESHQYFVDGTEYISATTLIDKYKDDFDQEFWSMYKGFELLLRDEYGDDVGVAHLNELKTARPFKGVGWFDWAIKTMGYSWDALKDAQARILQKWSNDNDESRALGSQYHARKELEAKTKGYAINPFNNQHYWVKKPGDLDNLDEGYYPELIIHDKEYAVIGTADRVFIGGKKKVWIDDFKSNKEIKKQNMFQSMHDPLGKLDDCNYNHYRLQIGLYAWMLERRGYNIRGISINHLGEHMKMRYSSIRPYIQAMVKYHFHGKATYGFEIYHT